MHTGILLSFSALSSFSPGTQAEIINYVKAQLSIEEGAAAVDDGEEPADLSVAQVNKFLERCSDKVKTALRIIAASDASGFKIGAVRTALGVDPKTGDLRGVWGGITKRARTVLGDPEAELIWWTEDSQDWVGRVSSTTHRSLRRALGL